MLNITQIVLLMPLLVLPFGCTRHLYGEGVRYTKGSFATLLSKYHKHIATSRILMTLMRSPDEPMLCPDSAFRYV